MIQIAPGWEYELDRGPEWLFVRIRKSSADAEVEPQVADAIWSILNNHFTYRVVLELEDITKLSTYLIGQLVLLHKRVHLQGGVMRLCGVNDLNQSILHMSRLDARFPQYRSRAEAVLGRRPLQPR